MFKRREKLIIKLLVLVICTILVLTIAFVVVQTTGTAVRVTGVTLNTTSLSVVKGNTSTLTATVAPSTVTNKAVTWKSSDTTIATVDANGKVTGVGAGTGTITCTASDGSNKTATCTVTVTNIAKPQANSSSKPLVTFVWDDGWVEDYNIVFPYLKSKGIKGCSAIITDFTDSISDYMTSSMLNEMQTYGWEFLSHTKTHIDLSQATESAQEYQLRISKEALIAKGINVESVVYPYNHYNDTTLKLAKQLYRAGLAFDKNNIRKYNSTPINQYALYRINTEDPLADNKEVIDECYKNNGWLIFMGHGHYYNATAYPDDSKWPGKYDSNLQKMKDNIEYCISKGFEVVTIKEGLDDRENIK